MAGMAKRTRQVLVWSIFRFSERYELPEDFKGLRWSPVLYTKDFVGSGRDDETISAIQQMNMLDELPQPQPPLLRGVFGMLKASAANHSRCYRGYLLDERLAPASDKKISQLIHLDIAATRKALKTLAKVGLIKKVPLPEFDLTINDGPKTKEPTTKKPKKKTAAKKKTKKKSAKSSSKPAKKAAARTSLEHSRILRSPLRVKDKDKDKDKSLTVIGKDKAQEEKETGSAAPHPEQQAGSNEPANPTGKPEEHKYQPPELKLHVNQSSQENPTEQDLLQTPATTHPNPKDPTESDTGQEQREQTAEQTNKIVEQNQSTESDAGEGLSKAPILRSSGSPPRSDMSRRLDAIYDPQAKEFAAKIFTAIGTPYPPGTTEANSELACFAAEWSQAQSAGLGPEALVELWDKSIAEAGKLKVKRRRINFKKSPEAVWVFLFKKRLAARVAGSTTKSHAI